MSSKVYFVVFLFFCVLCQLCEQRCAALTVQPADAADQNTIAEFFKPSEDDKIKDALKSDTALQPNEFSINYIQSAFLVAVNNVMVALAEVNYTEKTSVGNENKINIVAKYIDTNSENWKKKELKNTDEHWTVMSAGEKSKKINDKTVVKNFAVVIKEKNIYHITVSNNTFEDNGHSPAGWHVRLIKGDVKGEIRTGTQIDWKNLEVSVVTEGNQLEPPTDLQAAELPPSDGFAFVNNKSKNVIFIMKGKTKDGTTGEKNITAVFQLEESGSDNDNKLKLLNVDSTAGCYPAFFQWKEKIYKTPTNDQKCSIEKLMVFDENTNTFPESREPIASLLDFLKDKRNFTNAVIGTNNVLLFIQQKDATKKGDVNLWMYDGTRVGFVGAILKNIQGTFYGSLLYTDKGLFALHQKYQSGDSVEKEANKFSLTLLKEQLDKINSFLDAWKRNKETVLKLCDNIDTQKISCTTSPPTEGLVGFLHSTTNGDTGNVIWKDEYCYSNVTTESGKAESATNGLKFSGTGKRAKWSMQNQQQEKPYNFIDFGFTLVATVEIGSDTNGKKNSILGVTLTPNTNTNNNVGLWCDTNGKWGVSDRDGSPSKLSNTKCKQGNTYNVALVLGRENDKNLEIYVNGENLTTEIITIEPSESIEHFYFGARIDSDESYVTVTNVLLYNRPFDAGEIGKLQNYVKSVEVVTPPDQAVGTNTTGGNSDEPTTLPTSSDEKKEGPSPSRTEDGSVGGGVRVFSLLLAVLCVSAPLLHL